MTKKTIKMLLAPLSLIVLATTLQSAAQKDEVMVKENGGYVINTTELSKDIQGYAGTTPVKIYIRKNKVEKVEFLKNEETPKYFARVKKAMQTKWDGMKVKDAAALKVDGVTGATFSSDAVIKNVQIGLDFYQKNK